MFFKKSFKKNNLLAEELPALLHKSKQTANYGKPANYIPALANSPAHLLGAAFIDKAGHTILEGDHPFPFTLQSISKVFALLLALIDNGESAVFRKVGMEPSGDSYNSMIKLQVVEPGIPFNPFINAGAIAVSSLIHGKDKQEKSYRLLQFIQLLSGNPQISYNETVYISEAETADLNRSIAYLLKENEVISGEVEETLDVYFRQCAVEATVQDLAKCALVLAFGGVDPVSGKSLIPKRYVQITLALMLTCGMYDGSGQFAVQAGIPAKSAVSGAILAVVPNKLGIGVIAPALNKKGNSQAGVHLLEAASQKFNWSCF